MIRTLEPEEAAAAVEQGRADTVWLALPGIVRFLVARHGIHPLEILEAVKAGQLPVRYLGGGRKPRQPDPELCAINAQDLLTWLTQREIGGTEH